jgi:hypothetical protein
LKEIFQKVPDPRGKQGLDDTLWSILSLVIIELLCGRCGLKAASARACHDRTPAQCARLHKWNDPLPCRIDRDHAGHDALALADILGALDLAEGNDASSMSCPQ